MVHTTQEKAITDIRQKYMQMSSHLHERSRRVWAATEAKSIGWGGITIVRNATGMDDKTIRKGLKELENKDATLLSERLRRKGGGRKKKKDLDKRLVNDLEALIEPHTKGDPESPLKWTCKSTYKLADELVKKGYKIVQKTVYNILSELEYGMRGNRKEREEAKKHPDRNAQFECINEKVIAFHAEQNPTLSVDTKKKENIGNYKNAGKEWHQKGKNTEVNMHDFPNKKLGKVAPYGVYDIGKNKGWVSVGISSDTAQFAVHTIRSWWENMGKHVYQSAKKILITADCGGSNGYRVRLWKVELQKLANELQKEIHVCHFPPGTSKWNKIEHRMFSYISKNWRGRPLISQETVVNCISQTKTKTGLTIKAQLDENVYETGIVVSDTELMQVNLLEEDFHGEWNYKILPQDIE